MCAIRQHDFLKNKDLDHKQNKNWPLAETHRLQ